MAFADTIRTIAYVPQTQQARGFLPPLLRAMGHILYLLGCLASDDVTVTDEQAMTELGHARDHWNARPETNMVSKQTTERTATIATLFDEAIDEYPGWDANARVANLRDFANRLVQYTADLDRELLGIRDSDPGSSL